MWHTRLMPQSQNLPPESDERSSFPEPKRKNQTASQFLRGLRPGSLLSLPNSICPTPGIRESAHHPAPILCRGVPRRRDGAPACPGVSRKQPSLHTSTNRKRGSHLAQADSQAGTTRLHSREQRASDSLGEDCLVLRTAGTRNRRLAAKNPRGHRRL